MSSMAPFCGTTVSRCGKFYPASFVKNCDGIPRCSCGGIVKPDVVLYEEGLDEKTVEGALEAISTADMLLVAGTSLTVYPAAGFPALLQGKSPGAHQPGSHALR